MQEKNWVQFCEMNPLRNSTLTNVVPYWIYEQAVKSSETKQKSNISGKNAKSRIEGDGKAKNKLVLLQN